MEYFSIEQLDLPSKIWAPFADYCECVTYEPNQMIYFQGSEAVCFYYLKSGRVKTFISSEDGYEKALTVYQSGNLFGEAAFFDEKPRVSNAVAVNRCEIVKINREMAEKQMKEYPALALALLKYLARTVRLLSVHVDDMAFLRADQRVARYLVSLSPAADGTLHCTQDEIASTVSANRVTVARILSQFQKNGWIETGYRFIRVLNEDALQEMFV